MTWLQIGQNAVQLLTGPLAGILAVLAIVASAAYSMFHGHWGWFFSVAGGAAVLVGAPWFVQTIYGIAG